MSAARQNIFEKLGALKVFWPILALAILLGYNAFANPTFFNISVQGDYLYGTLINVLRDGSPYMLLALGMTLVIATYGIDLSVGSVVAISGVLAAQLVTKTEYPFALVMAITLGATMLLGMWNGTLVAYVGIQPIVATLILMVAGRGLGKLISRGQMVPFESHAAYVALMNGHLLYLPLSVWIVALVFLITWVLTRKTAIGLFIESVGNNQTASNFCGLNARMVKVLAYGFSGFCAGLAGMLAASNTKIADPSRAGLYMELDAIFAVVVGGTALSGGRFTLVGSIIGAILLQTLAQTFYYEGISPDVAPVPKAIVILAVCLLQAPKFRRLATSFFRKAA